MNERISLLRQNSLDAVNRISGERAGLVTGFYRQPFVAALPVPVQRGMALKHIMQHKC